MGQQIAAMSKGMPNNGVGGMADYYNPVSKEPWFQQSVPQSSTDPNRQAPAVPNPMMPPPSTPAAAMAGTPTTSAAGTPAQSADEARMKILQLFRGY